jgi:hypothetical protein
MVGSKVHRWGVALTSLVLLAVAGRANAPPIEAPLPHYESHPLGSEPGGPAQQRLWNDNLRKDFLAPSDSPGRSDTLRAGRFQDSGGTLRERGQTLAPSLQQRFGEPVTLPDNTKAYHVQPNLLLREAEITDTVLSYLNTKIDDRKIAFAGYFDRSLDDYQRVAEASDGNFVDLGDSQSNPAGLFSRNTGQIVAVVGHSVDGYLVRDRKKDDGSFEEVSRIEISDLESAAAKNGVLLFLLTCQGAAGSQSPGVLGDIWTPNVVAGIVRARAATTYGEFFAAFGTNENPTLAQTVQTDAEGVLSGTFKTTVDDREVVGVAPARQPSSSPPPSSSPASAPATSAPPPPSASIFQSWWFWAIIVAAVIVGLVAWRRR